MEKRDQFTIRTPEYLESYGPFRDHTSLSHIATQVEEKAQKKGDTLRCLDSMAGTGIVGREMRKVFKKIKVTFQDKSQKMLSSKVYQNDERILSDARAIGISDETFDIIFCRGGLNNIHADDYPKVLREYMRVLGNNGIAIVQDHFAPTEEGKEVINQIETEVAEIEGRDDETYSPTVEELRKLIRETRGQIISEQSFEIHSSMKDRFACKGLHRPDLSGIIEILKNQKSVRYELVGDDIILSYPIFTVTFEKQLLRT